MKKKPEEKIDEDWLATYGDMVTLLMCFFVLMVAVSKVDMALFEQVQAGMNKGLGQKEVPRPIEMMVVELTDDVQSLRLEDGISLGSDAQGVFIDMDTEIMFPKGSAELKQEFAPVLKRLVATIMSDRYYNFVFIIDGHTSDEAFSSPQFPTNWELSAARAAAVVRFFEERGITRARLKAVGLYDTAPKLPNLDPFGQPIPQNRAKNNRVVVHASPTYK